MVGAVRFELTTSCTPSKRAYQTTLRPEPLKDSNQSSAGFNRENVTNKVRIGISPRKRRPPARRLFNSNFNAEVGPAFQPMLVSPFVSRLNDFWTDWRRQRNFGRFAGARAESGGRGQFFSANAATCPATGCTDSATGATLCMVSAAAVSSCPASFDSQSSAFVANSPIFAFGEISSRRC